jgi:hypothetical protein
MSENHRFDLLTGFVFIDGDAPDALRDEAGGLDSFYVAPNAGDGLGPLARVLFHESLHFWQVAASSCVAWVVVDEWQRVIEFESTGKVMEPSPRVRAFMTKAAGEPFSALDLFECWTRYWDLHTRSPAKALEDAGVEAEGASAARHYDDKDFAKATAELDDCAAYARPYRWLREQAGERWWFVDLALPIVLYRAMQTDEPVKMFREAFSIGLANEELISHCVQAMRVSSPDERFDLHGAGPNINFAWLLAKPAIERYAIRPAAQSLGIGHATPGIKLFSDLHGFSHPIYADIPARGAQMAGEARLCSARIIEEVKKTPRDFLMFVSGAALFEAGRDPETVLMFPGQPDFRWLLGKHFCPARVVFSNRIVHGKPSARWLMQRVHEKMAAAPAGSTIRIEGDFEAECSRVADRVGAFEKACSG